MEAAKTKAQSLIDENAVMVFSKSYCPYCRASKKTLQNAGAQFKVYELNEESQYNPPTHQPTPRPSFLHPRQSVSHLGAYRGEGETHQEQPQREVKANR